MPRARSTAAMVLVTGRRDGTTFRRGADVARQAETDALNGRLRARLVTCCVPQPCQDLGPTGIMAVQDLKGGRDSGDPPVLMPSFRLSMRQQWFTHVRLLVTHLTR
jgi:hypothetical protein